MYNSLLQIMDKISEKPPLLFEKFTPLYDYNLNNEPWNEILTLYQSKIVAHKIAGIIINGVLTNQKPTYVAEK